MWEYTHTHTHTQNLLISLLSGGLMMMFYVIFRLGGVR